MSLKILDQPKKHPIRMMIPPASGVSGAKNRHVRRKRNRRASVRKEKLPPTPVVEPLRVAHKCSRTASCPISSAETAPCDGSDLLACDHRRLRPRVRDVTAPRTSPSPGSIGSARRACVWDHRPLPHRPLPKPSMDDSPEHFSDKG